MPTFCRHNRFLERCPICRQTLGGGGGAGARAGRSRPPGAGSGSRGTAAPRRGAGAGPGGNGRAGTGTRAGAAAPLRVSRAARAEADGYRCELLPGLHASQDARGLAGELAFAAARLSILASAPPGLFGEAAADPDRGRATRLVMLACYLSPLEGDGDPFAGIRSAWPAWERGEIPDLSAVPLGPRTSHDPRRGAATLEAFLAWERRAGSAEAAIVGDPGWTPARRFERAFERLALPGLGRGARYDFLVTLGRLSVYDLRPDTLALGGDDDVLVAAKRVFGIGERGHLERRAGALAAVAGVPIEALDLALWNWQRGERAMLGVRVDETAVGADPGPIAAVLGL